MIYQLQIYFIRFYKLFGITVPYFIGVLYVGLYLNASVAFEYSDFVVSLLSVEEGGPMCGLLVGVGGYWACVCL